MKLIVAPTDFSHMSINAVNYAAELAASIKADLLLIHVYQSPMIFGEVPALALDISEMVAAAEENMDKLKKDLILTTSGLIKVSSKVETGIVMNEVKGYCDNLKPFAVVMASHGAGAMERFLLGSNTVSAMKHLNCPLIVVPEDAKFRNIRNIGLACDYRKVADTTPIEEIKLLIKEFNASLFVVYVNHNPAEDFAEGVIHQSEVLEKMLEELNPKYDFIAETDVDKGLADYAAVKNLDLLILAPRKHSLMERIFLRSHTKEMVLHAPVPLMTLHED